MMGKGLQNTVLENINKKYKNTNKNRTVANSIELPENGLEMEKCKEETLDNTEKQRTYLIFYFLVQFQMLLKKSYGNTFPVFLGFKARKRGKKERLRQPLSCNYSAPVEHSRMYKMYSSDLSSLSWLNKKAVG